MREFVKGMLARSKAGHDTGKLYVVMDADTVCLSGRRSTSNCGQHQKEKEKAHSDYL